MYTTIEMGVWSRSKIQKDKRTKGLQINRIIGHLPQEGKNKWLYLFSAIELLQFPGWSGRGERNVVLQRPFLSLLYRIVDKGVS